MKKYCQVPQDIVLCGDLPDGTVSLVDTRDSSVHALDRVSSEAWKACAQRRGLDEILQTLACGEAVNAARVELALDQLVDLKLLTNDEDVTEVATRTSRRRALLRIAAGALPVILSLTSAEQKAFAQGAGSGTTTTPAPETTTTTTPDPVTTTTTTTTPSPVTTTTPAP